MATFDGNALQDARDDVDWRKNVVAQLRERNRSETCCFHDLISLRKFFDFVLFTLVLILASNIALILFVCLDI